MAENENRISDRQAQLANKVLGQYLISAFVIRISDKLDATSAGLIPRSSVGSTFWHEYHHFVVDVSTYFGQAVFFISLMATKWAPFLFKRNSLVALDPKVAAKDPGNLVDVWRDRHKNAVALLLGTDLDESDAIVANGLLTGRIEVFQQIIWAAEDKTEIPVPFIEVPGSQLGRIVLGGWVLVEGLAHLLQEKLEGVGYPGTQHPFVPYRVAETLASRFGCTRKDHVAVLCDQALLDLAAGARFLDYLEHYQRENWSRLSPIKLARACRRVRGDTEDGLVDGLYKTVRSNIDSHDLFAKGAYEWYERCMTAAKAKRKADRLFFVRPLFADDPEAALAEIPRVLPSPTVLEETERPRKDKSDITPPHAVGGSDADIPASTFLGSVIHMLNVADSLPETGAAGCPHWTGCGFLHIKDEIDCRVAPWLKGGEDKMCCIGAANKHLGIEPPARNGAGGTGL